MFAQELELVHDSVEDNGSYSTVMDAIDSEWFEQSLLASNIPNRRLPAQQAAWLVLWTGLIRNHSIKEACGSMGIALQPGDNAWSRVAPSVLKDCRRRLVEVPMSYLFKSTVSAWLEQALGESNDLGLTTLAVDGTVFRCQDSEENAQEFGFISNTHKPYLQLRLVSLISTEIRMVLGAAFDRCYFSADLLLNWENSGKQRHWLTPVKSKMCYEIVEKFADNDLLIDLPVSPQARNKNLNLPETWPARFIAYKKPKGEIKGFVTSLVDPVKYSLDKLLSIYWQRWEMEEGYGELKQTQLQSNATKPFCRRCKTGTAGVLIAYNLVRLEMVAIAKEAEVAPTRISFTAEISLIDTELR